MNSPPGMVVTIGLVISSWINSPSGVGNHYWVGDILDDEVYQELVVTIGLMISLWMNSPQGGCSHYWVGDILVDEQYTRCG